MPEYAQKNEEEGGDGQGCKMCFFFSFLELPVSLPAGKSFIARGGDVIQQKALKQLKRCTFLKLYFHIIFAPESEKKNVALCKLPLYLEFCHFDTFSTPLL